MATNQFNKKKKEKVNGKKNAFSRLVQSMLDGSILGRESVVSLIPFFFFLTGLAFLLIFNTYYAEKKAREIEITRRQVVELRTRYINTKSELMFLSNQSEIARKLRSQGFVESTEPPRLVYDHTRRRNIFARMFTGR
jgi:hypothetical protein